MLRIFDTKILVFAILVLVEVGSHTALEIFCFAHIYDGVFLVVVLIAPRLLGKIRNNTFEFLLKRFLFCLVHGVVVLRKKRPRPWSHVNVPGEGGSPLGVKWGNNAFAMRGNYSLSVSKAVISALFPRNSFPFSPSMRSSMRKLT